MRRTLAVLILSASALFGQAGNSGYGVGGGAGGGTYSFSAPLSLSGSTVSLGTSGVTGGNYTCLNATINTQGIITSATSGTCTGGSGAWGSITGTLSAQTDLQTALNAKQNTITVLPVANGGTGTASPGIVAGTNVTVTGTWPNQTVNSTGGGGGGNIVVSSLPGTCTQGSTYFLTTATPNQQLYDCTTANTFVLHGLVGPTGALSVNSSTGATDIVTSVVPRIAAANPFTGRNSFDSASDLKIQAAPASPASGYLSLYANTDGSLHYKNSAGTDAALATGAGFANPMTAQDDVIVGGASGAATKLVKGADNQVLGIDPNTHHIAYINGGGSPAGSTYSVQTNSSGAFSGSSEFTYGDPAMGGASIHRAGISAFILWDTDDSTPGGDYVVFNSGTADGAGGNNRKIVMALSNAGNGSIVQNAFSIGDESGFQYKRFLIAPSGRVALGGDGTTVNGGSTLPADIQASYQSFGAYIDNDGVTINSPNQSAACDADHRGLFKFVKSASGSADHVDVCAKNASDAYAFVRVF